MCPLRVEICQRTITIQKCRLHNLFRLSWIVHDPHGHAVHQPVVTVEQHGEGILFTGKEIGSKALIALRVQSAPAFGGRLGCGRFHGWGIARNLFPANPSSNVRVPDGMEHSTAHRYC